MLKNMFYFCSLHAPQSFPLATTGKDRLWSALALIQGAPTIPMSCNYLFPWDRTRLSLVYRRSRLIYCRLSSVCCRWVPNLLAHWWACNGSLTHCVRSTKGYGKTVQGSWNHSRCRTKRFCIDYPYQHLMPLKISTDNLTIYFYFCPHKNPTTMQNETQVITQTEPEVQTEPKITHCLNCDTEFEASFVPNVGRVPRRDALRWSLYWKTF